MSFLDIIDEHRNFDIKTFLDSVTSRKVEDILAKERISELDFLSLLSERALQYLEPMAQKAYDLTRKYFGNVILLFTPLYVSNYCDNSCKYCSFAKGRRISRRHLSYEEIRKEAQNISETGMRHILVLTGECREKATIDYLARAIEIIGEFFSSIGIEVYPLTADEYERLVRRGVDSLTIYQEVYDKGIYHHLHAGGQKDNYQFRLDAPERACSQNIHGVAIGALLGLNDFRYESFRTALHIKYLQDTFPGTEISVSLPRVRPLAEDFQIPFPVSDRHFVQLLTAFRICFPSVGITISTRESREFRDNILPLGVTKMSAGVSTAVGGHSGDPSTTQFDIADTRSLEETKSDLLARGYQPVMHDWNSRMFVDSQTAAL